jgi:nitrous oxide reductase
MAEEKPRAPRARKKTTEADKKTVVGKTAAKRFSGIKATSSASTSATKKKAPAAPRAKKSQPVVVEPGDVATLAYLLWERGEPGDAAEHWLRAEQDLEAA